MLLLLPLIARRRILLHWKSPNAPPTTSWFTNLMSLEKVKYSLRGSATNFYKRSQPLTTYVTSLTSLDSNWNYFFCLIRFLVSTHPLFMYLLLIIIIIISIFLSFTSLYIILYLILFLFSSSMYVLIYHLIIYLLINISSYLFLLICLLIYYYYHYYFLSLPLCSWAMFLFLVLCCTLFKKKCWKTAVE